MTAALATVAARRAGLVTRFCAFVGDALVLLVGLRGTVWLLGAVAHALRRFAPPVNLPAMVVASAPFVIAVYNIVFWRLYGQTPGKWVMGIKVVPTEGGRLPVRRAVLRMLGYLVSALPCYLGFLWILGPSRRGWHDRLARTEVVYVPERRAGLRSSAAALRRRELRPST